MIEEAELKAALEDQQVKSLHLGRVLIDKQLVSGVQLGRALAPIPVIMLTAKSKVEAEVTILDAGADDYVVKPVDRRRFMARVNRLLKRKDLPTSS